MRKNYLVFIFLFVTGILACNKEEVNEIFEGFKKPANFPVPSYHLNTNPVSKAGFELGRKLFYDQVLSANNTISCGSCHIPTAAFTHHGHRVSHGINNLSGTRNSPPIMNLAWNTTFMWDGGVGDMDLQPIAPITSHVEMDETVENVLMKLRAKSPYPMMFRNAFGTEEINTARFLKALSQFMSMCISSQSKYDSVQRHEGNVSFNAQEVHGYSLFKSKCNSCHKEPLFSDQSFRNNGLTPNATDDKGRYLVTLNPADKYLFKVPSLRNLKYTPPYMHDGRFFTLEEVLDHYTDGVQPTVNLDPLLQQGGIPGIALSGDEKADILAFLETLNDRNFVTNRLLSEQ
jgi:cytochrome c peroxidase